MYERRAKTWIMLCALQDDLDLHILLMTEGTFSHVATHLLQFECTLRITMAASCNQILNIFVLLEREKYIGLKSSDCPVPK